VIASVHGFLGLFPSRTRRALRKAAAASVVLAALDFTALILVFPVFTTLMSPAGQRASVAGPLDGVGTGVLITSAMSVMILRAVGGFAYRYWWTREVAEAEIALSSRLLTAYAYAPFSFHLRRNSADLLAKAVSHVNIASTAGLNGLALIAVDATTVAALAAALFAADPAAAAVVCGYLSILGIGFVVISRRFSARQSRLFADQVGLVYRRATTVLRGIRELTVAGARPEALSSIQRSRRTMVCAQRNMTILAELPRMILEIALYGALLVALFLVLHSSDRDRALPVVALYVVAGLRILPAIARGLSSVTQARTGAQLGGQVAAELEEVEGVEFPAPRPADASLPRCGDLRLDDVQFSYDRHDWVLKGVNLHVPFGGYVAVIGSSGAGKSTLLGIVLGLLPPTFGTVTYGGADIGLSDARWLRHVGYVPQDVFVLDDTVTANVALGDAEPDVGRVWAALEQASLADAVRRLPQSLGTVLGEAGSRLSAGQRQRLGLARALYRAPAVLVLDEPTASLDRQTEAQVAGTISRLKGTVTIVMVTHRPEAMGDPDGILLLQDGVLQQTGERIGLGGA